MMNPAFSRIAVLVGTAAVSLTAGTLTGDRFLLEVRAQDAAYLLQLDELQIEFNFLSDTEALVTVDSAGQGIPSWMGNPAKVAAHASLVAALEAFPQASEGLHELAGRLKATPHVRLLGIAEGLLKAAGFRATEPKEEKKELKATTPVSRAVGAGSAGAGAGVRPGAGAGTPAGSRLASPASVPGHSLLTVTHFGPLRLLNQKGLSPRQKAVFHGHLALATRAIGKHVSECVANLKVAQKSRFPQDQLDRVYRFFQNDLFAQLAKAFPTQDVAIPSGGQVDTIAQQAAATFVTTLEAEGGLLLELLGGDGPKLTQALQGEVKAAFAPEGKATGSSLPAAAKS